MKKRFSFLFTVFTLINSFAQSSWINYANDDIIWDIDFEEDSLWVATQGGLVKINMTSGDKEVFQAWNSGFKGTEVAEIEIANDGTKWIGGGNNGLFKFDGVNWEHFYDINTGDILIEIKNLKLDTNDNPWFFSNINNNCGGCRKLISYDGDKFIKHNENLGLDPDKVGFIDFEFINSEQLWVALGKKIMKYSGTEILEEYDSINTPLSEKETINQIEIDNQDNLWVTTSDYSTRERVYRILKFDGENWYVENEAAPGKATKFFQDDTGILWFNFYENRTYEKTYASYDGTNWRYWSSSDIPELPSLWHKPTLHKVDSQGNWWMFSYGAIREPKIYKIEGDSYTSYNTEIFPLGTNYYNDIIADCENNIWLSGRGVLTKFDGENWKNFTDAQTGFNGTPREAVIDPTNCDIWFSFYSSGLGNTDLGRYNGSDFEVFSLEVGSANSVDVSDNGIVYIGTNQNGLGQYINDTWEYFNEENAPINNYVFSVKVQSDETVWVASYGAGIARKKGTEWTVFDSSNSPVEDYTTRIIFDNNENVWVRSGAGLAKYDGTSWETFSFGLPPSGVNFIVEDHIGNYWIGTQVGALYWNGFDLIKFDVTNSNIGSNSTRDIHIDPTNGDVWFLHDTGVSVLRDFHSKNSINGIVFFDADQDGIFDSNEDVRLPNQKITLLPDSSIAITNNSGAYGFYPKDTTDYQLTYHPNLPYIPTSSTIIDTFFDGTVSIEDMNFGVWAEVIPSDIAIDITLSPLICDNQANVWITFKNEGFVNASGEIVLKFDENFTFVDAHPEVVTIENKEITWSFSDLKFMQSRTYKVILSVPGVESLSEEYSFTSEIITDTKKQSATATGEILCSYDPNDKIATPMGESSLNYSLIDTPIQYTVRFQNLGNYLAKDVVISDTIDSYLDISTFEVISASHEMNTTIDQSREVTFRFENIDLPPEEQDTLGSQGYVKYQISPLEGIPNSTIVKNTAAIYFDFNPAIITNTTENTLVESLTVKTDNQKDQQKVLVYPNPSNSDIWIDWQQGNNDAVWQVDVYDLSGKILLTKKSSSLKESIHITQKGFYILKIRRGEYTYVEKAVVLGV